MYVCGGRGSVWLMIECCVFGAARLGLRVFSRAEGGRPGVFREGVSGWVGGWVHQGGCMGPFVHSD